MEKPTVLARFSCFSWLEWPSRASGCGLIVASVLRDFTIILLAF